MQATQVTGSWTYAMCERWIFRKFLFLGFRGWSSMFNFGFRSWAASYSLPHVRLLNTPNHYTFTLKMATAMFAETLDNFQYSTRLNPESRSYTFRKLHVFPTRFRSAVGPNITHIQREPGAQTRGLQRPERTADHTACSLSWRDA
jgi:hypothetical protein